MTDRTKLRKVSQDPAIAARIQNYIKLFTALSAQHRGQAEPFGLPVQIVGDTVLSGDMSTEEMLSAWEKALGVKPQ
jgi:hypothetical protein